MRLDKYISKIAKKISPEIKQQIRDLAADPNYSLERDYESWLSGNVSPKIKQKIELLLVNKRFMQRVLFLRKKWAPLVKEFGLLQRQAASVVMKAEVAENKFELLPPLPATTKKLNKLRVGERFNEVLTREDLDRDAIALAEENKLHPLEWWKESIKFFILMNIFIPISYLLTVNLRDYLAKDQKFKVPAGLNFEPMIRKNQKTGELELITKIFEDTSLLDMKKNWKLIKEAQSRLREIKNIKEKHFYPLKNIGTAKKIDKLKKKGKSDWEIQEDIFGEIPGLNFGKKETKRKNLVKQLRHQYKKRGII